MNLKDDISLIRPLFLFTLILFLSEQVSLAQDVIKAQDASRKFDLQIQIDACGREKHNNDPDNCSGVLRIYMKGVKSPPHVLILPNVEIFKDSIAYNSSINKQYRPNNEWYSFVFEDFNFDGNEDLAVCNGRNSAYAGASYDIYLFNEKSNKFIWDKSLTRLAGVPYLGLFSVDWEKKLLIADYKSGSSYGETDKYRIVNSKPVLVEKITYQFGEKVTVVTTTRMINGKWVKKVSKERSQLKDE